MKKRFRANVMNMRYVFVMIIAVSSMLMDGCSFRGESTYLDMRMTVTWGNVYSRGKIELSRSESKINFVEGYGFNGEEVLNMVNRTWETVQESFKPASFNGVVFRIQAPDDSDIIITFNGTRYTTRLDKFMEYRRLKWSLNETNLVLTGIPVPGGKRLPDHGKNIYSYSLHTHSHFSDATYFTINEQVDSIARYVDNVWWTDHDFWFSSDPGCWGKDYSGEGPGSPGSDRENGSLMLEKTWDGEELQYLFGPPVKVLKTIACGIKFSFWMYPVTGFNQDKGAFVKLELGPGRRNIYYLFSSNMKNVERKDAIILKYEPGKWNYYERNITRDYNMLYGDDDLALWFVKPGVFTSNGNKVKVYFDNFQLDYEHLGKKLWDEQKKHMTKYKSKIHSICGLELTTRFNGIKTQDYIQPHYTVLFPPGNEELFYIPRGKFEYPAREKYFDKIHEGNGVVAVHHLNHRLIRNLLLKKHVKNIDLYEINYDWGETEPLNQLEKKIFQKLNYSVDNPAFISYTLMGWDGCTKSGIYLTGYSAPDLHGRFDTPRFIPETHNSHLSPGITWVYARSNVPEDILESLRIGQCYFGDSVEPVVLDMETSQGFQMGSVVHTDKSKNKIYVTVKGNLENYTLRVIRKGVLWKTIPIGNKVNTIPVIVDTESNTFIRCELYDKYNHPVAFTNFISFIKQQPEKYPWGRNCLDWNGVTIKGTDGLLIHGFRFIKDNKTIAVNAQSTTKFAKLHVESSKLKKFRLINGEKSIPTTNGFILYAPGSKGKMNIRIVFAQPFGNIIGRKKDFLSSNNQARKKLQLDINDKRDYYYQLMYSEPITKIVSGDLVSLTKKKQYAWKVNNGSIMFKDNMVVMESSGEGIFSLSGKITNIENKGLLISSTGVEGKIVMYIAINYGNPVQVTEITSPGSFKIKFSDYLKQKQVVVSKKLVEQRVNFVGPKENPGKIVKKTVSRNVIVTILFQVRKGEIILGKLKIYATQ